MLNKLIVVFSFFLLFAINCLSQNIPTVAIDTIRESRRPEGGYLYYPDPSRKMSFEEVIEKPFRQSEVIERQNGAAYWFKFKIDTKLTKYTYVIGFNRNDFIDVYVPLHSGYKKYTLGQFVFRNPVSDMRELNILSFNAQEVDFSRPFYYRKTIISSEGTKHLDYQPVVAYVYSYDDVKASVLTSTFNPWLYMYLGFLLLAFMLFIVNYSVTKDNNFLHYSLYLLSVFIYHANRLPMIFNLYGEWSVDILAFYVNPVSNIASMCLYFYFAVKFLNYEQFLPQLYKISISFIRFIVIAGILYLLFIAINPYELLHEKILLAIRVIFIAISIILLTILYFKKRDLISRIVVVGSVVLILGSVFALLLGNYIYFLPTVVVETILFAWIVSYQNKQKEMAHLENQFALQKMQEVDHMKTRFFTNVSHEFRTPLTIILGTINQMTKIKNLPFERELNTMHHHATRLLRLINQILDLAKLNVGQLKLHAETIDLRQFLEDTLVSLESGAVVKGLSFAFNIRVPSSLVNIDHDKLEKIVFNLISNAIKFTPKGGSIDVNIEQKSDEEDRLIIVVKDTGIGIESSQMDKIFDRYYQAEKTNEVVSAGSGIGLSMTRELVYLLGGTINVQSKKGEGSIFRVELPLEVIEHRGEAKATVPVSKTRTVVEKPIDSQMINKEKDGPRVMAVEDDPDILRFIVSCLEEYPYQIITAQDGQEGLSLARQEVPDLIISDFWMPEKDGVEMTADIKKDRATSHIPIIMLTANATRDGKIEGLKTGADDYIVKPFDPEELQLKADNLLKQQERLRQRFAELWHLPQAEKSVKPKEDVFISEFRELVEKNLENSELSIHDLTHELALSRVQLYRKTMALTGQSPTDLVRHIRLKKAAVLLSNPDHNVSETAYAVGFSNLSYFAKSFKQVYGLTPSEFKKQG